MKKTIFTLFLSVIFGMGKAQEVNTYSVYDTNQSGDLTVADVTGVIDKVKANIATANTQQYVTAEELKTLFSTILTKLEGVESRLSAIEAQVGIERPSNTEEGKTFTANGVTFKMMLVSRGTFTMGATSEQSNGYTPASHESPTHEVTLSDYYIGETEVTQALWYAVMGAKPSASYSWSDEYGFGENYPAYYISWEECLSFITTLNTITGAAFRMPTEAEWEYAARGGSKSKWYIFSGSNTIEDVAWYTDNASSKTHQVKNKNPNELGIYDMSGNVFEWCSDWYGSYPSSAQTNPTGASSGSQRVFRGGCYSSNDSRCRVAMRDYDYPNYHGCIIGLRLALSK